jgi:DegV family protein with EDD domain
MSGLCVLTDGSVQFTRPDFPGRALVHVIPFNDCQAVCPSPQDFINSFASLSLGYDTILVLTNSSLLDSAMINALTALDECSHTAWVELIDSQTTAIGLGLLVQMAACAASHAASLKEIVRQLRTGIPRIYMLACIPQLTCLASAGLMDHSQALVAEMLGMLPIFAFEEGRLVPMQKVRTPRHLFEAFQDFMSEFESPSQIALLRNPLNGHLNTNPIRAFVRDHFPETIFSEHPIQPYLSGLFGPGCIGLVVME